MLAVGADAADDGGEVDDEVGAEIGVHALHVFVLDEVVVRDERHEDVAQPRAGGRRSRSRRGSRRRR
jgi:hypothetical protein